MRGARICSPISLIVALLILAGSLDAAVAATAEECTSAWQQCELNCGLYPGGTVANNYCHADCATKQSVCIGTSKSETSAKPTNLPPKNNVGIRPITSGGVKTGGNPPKKPVQTGTTQPSGGVKPGTTSPSGGVVSGTKPPPVSGVTKH